MSVYFPSRGSAAEMRYGGELVVVGADPRWDRQDPPDRLPRLIQDLTGRLRGRSLTSFLSLRMSAMAVTPAGERRAGVASPTAQMMFERAAAYNDSLAGGGQAAFFVDVPVAGNGRIGLVYPDPDGTQPGGWVQAASTADVVDLIRRGGYVAESQVIQILAAPAQEHYLAYVAHAEEIADELGRDVYIVGRGGATVTYQRHLGGFSAVRGRLGGGGAEDQDGVRAGAVPWRLLRPTATRAQGEAPEYLGTDDDGILAAPGVARRIQTFANLVTFERSQDVLDRQHDYRRYQEHGGSELGAVVVPTRAGVAVGSGSASLPAGWAAQAVSNLRFHNRPVRLLFCPLDGIPVASRMEDWALAFANELKTAVYATDSGRFDYTLSDFTADGWRSVVPPDSPRALAMPRYVRNPVSGLLVPEDLAVNPLPAPLDGTDVPSPGEVIVQQYGPILLLPTQEDGRLPIESLPKKIGEGQIVIVAPSRDGRTVMGARRQDGRASGEPDYVPVPPERMVQIIRSASRYAPGTAVTFLVPGLGGPSFVVSAPEHYAQQVANLLQTQVRAVRPDNPSGGNVGGACHLRPDVAGHGTDHR